MLLLSLAAAVAFLLLLILLPAHLRGRNAALLTLILCGVIFNIVQFVNTIVWASSVRDVAPVWCDISTNLSLYVSFATEGAAFCVSKQLEWLSSPRSTKAGRPHSIWLEIAICCIMPLISIPIRYVVSSHRYLILETFGCAPSIFDSVFTAAFIFAPQLVISLGGLIYAGLAARHIVRMQISLSAHLSMVDNTVTTSRFIRLLVLCFIMGVWPLCVEGVVMGIALSQRSGYSSAYSWPGWKAMHAAFHQIPMVPTAEQPIQVRGMWMSIFWMRSVGAYFFFAFLTTSEGVREDLRGVWSFIRKNVLKRQVGGPPPPSAVQCPSEPVIVIGRTTATCSSRDSQFE